MVGLRILVTKNLSPFNAMGAMSVGFFFFFFSALVEERETKTER